jgi:hypothetical protein
MQNLEPVLDFQVFNLITRAYIVSVTSLLAPCGIAEGTSLRMYVFVSAATGGQVSFRELTNKPLQTQVERDHWDFGGCLKSMVLSIWRRALTRGGPSAIKLNISLCQQGSCREHVPSAARNDNALLGRIARAWYAKFR